jgi:hypothetical protein
LGQYLWRISRKISEKYIENLFILMEQKIYGNAKVFKKNASLVFTDLDTDWLINERHRDLNDWNGIDIISMINN